MAESGAEAAVSSRTIPGFYCHPEVRPECRPFYVEASGEEAVVFIHGYTGSPLDFRNYVPPYTVAGFDVYVPLIPGHGSHVVFLDGLNYQDLYRPFEPLADFLRRRYRQWHLVAMSYGCIPAVQLAISHQPTSLTLFSPAFYLQPKMEKLLSWVSRLHLHWLFSRVRKSAAHNPHMMPGEKGSRIYNFYSLLPASGLYRQASLMRPKLKNLALPILHVHGDADRTTPFGKNVRFLETQLDPYDHVHIRGGGHILTLDRRRLKIAEHHIRWLKSQGRQSVNLTLALD